MFTVVGICTLASLEWLDLYISVRVCYFRAWVCFSVGLWPLSFYVLERSERSVQNLQENASSVSVQFKLYFSLPRPLQPGWILKIKVRSLRSL